MPEQLEMTLEEYQESRKRSPRRGKKGPSREHIIQNQILAYLETQPHIYAYRVNSGRIKTDAGRLVMLAPPGSADICGYISLEMPERGRCAVFLAIEVKADAKKQPTDLQQAYLDGVRQAGGCAFVARSVEDVVRGLEQFAQKAREM